MIVLFFKGLYMVSDIFTSFGDTCKKVIKFKSRANRKEYIYYTIVLILFNIFLYPIGYRNILKSINTIV